MARILVADDEPMVRRTLRHILLQAGHAVIEACDGDEALAAFQHHQPDLVLIDIIMPNRDGVETIAALRAADNAVPILAMSGGGVVGSARYLDFAGTRGATRMLAKPLRNAELLQAIADCLAAAGPPVGG